MNKDYLAQLSANAAACAERLSLPLKNQVWRGMAGEFQGAGTGSSTDFQDHRSYTPGDDPRHINWQAYARTGQYTMKLYREEVSPVIDIILDASESMFFDVEKSARVAELLYFVTKSARQSGAQTKIFFLKGDEARPLTMESISSHQWYHMCKEYQSPAEKANAPLAINKLRFRPQAIRIFISDLLFEGDPPIHMRQLAANHGKVIILSPYLTKEAQPAWSGNYEFVDAESSSQHSHRIEKYSLDNYIKAYSTHFSAWKNSARKFNAVLSRIHADQKVDILTAMSSDAVKSGAVVTL